MAATDLSKMAIYQTQRDVGLLELVSPTERVGPASTGYADAVPIGFDFRFDGVSYDECRVSACGYVQFAGSAISDASSLFTSDTNVIVAPWCDGMITAHSGTSGYVKTETQGVAPFRRFIVEWLVFAGISGLRHVLQFQCVLYETKDRIEYRYGPRVHTPGANLMSAGRAIKANTSVQPNRYRDMGALGFGTTLGGSSSSSITNLTDSLYDEHALYTWVMEPNWPMCGRLFLLSPDEISGRDLYGDVLWKIANFANCLPCLHTPPLILFSPYHQSLTHQTAPGWPGGADASVIYVVPVEPSGEDLDYTAYVQLYSSSGGVDYSITIDIDARPDPQPGNPLDWTQMVTVTGPASSGWNEPNAFQVAIPLTAEYVRITVSVPTNGSRTVQLGSLLVVPELLADIDVDAVSAIGFRPMAIAAFRQDGAAIHAEWFNRGWRNIAHVLRDRRQMVWSSVWPELEIHSLQATTARPTRAIGVSKAWLPVRGARCKARLYALDTVGEATLELTERGNARLAKWDVEASSGYYVGQTADVELASNEPHIAASCAPNGMLSPMSLTIDWAPTLSTSPLFPGVTPAAKLSGLFALAQRMEFALRCYVATGQAAMFARGKTTSNVWRAQAWIPPAVTALRPKIARDSDDLTGTSLESRVFAASSGSSSADEIIIETPHQFGRDDYPPEGAIAFAAPAEVYDPTPASAMSRLLESPTATSMASGARERIELVRGVGLVVVPARFADPHAI